MGCILSERARLLTKLYSDLLGPKGGPEETLSSAFDPRENYMTGVLIPRDTFDPEARINSDFDDFSSVNSSSHDIGDTSSSSPVFTSIDSEISNLPSPSLDPRQRPCSFGLSFMVEGKRPVIDVCATWGHYNISDGEFVRKPKGHLRKGLEVVEDAK